MHTEKSTILLVCEIDCPHPVYGILACIYLAQFSLIQRAGAGYHWVGLF